MSELLYILIFILVLTSISTQLIHLSTFSENDPLSIGIAKERTGYSIPLRRCKSLKVSSAEYFVYMSLLREIKNNGRNDLCTDNEGWVHFCAFVASQVFLDIRNGNFENDDDKKYDKTLMLLMEKAVNENTITEYIKDLFIETNLKGETIFVKHNNIPEGYSITPHIMSKMLTYCVK